MSEYINIYWISLSFEGRGSIKKPIYSLRYKTRNPSILRFCICLFIKIILFTKVACNASLVWIYFINQNLLSLLSQLFIVFGYSGFPNSEVSSHPELFKKCIIDLCPVKNLWLPYNLDLYSLRCLRNILMPTESMFCLGGRFSWHIKLKKSILTTI